MQGWHYGKGLIYYRPILRLIKLAFLKARAIPTENKIRLPQGQSHNREKISNSLGIALAL